MSGTNTNKRKKAVSKPKQRSRDAGKPHVKMWVLWAPNGDVTKATAVNYIDNYGTEAAKRRHIRHYQKWGASLASMGLVWQWRIYDGALVVDQWSNYNKEAAAAKPAQA